MDDKKYFRTSEQLESEVVEVGMGQWKIAKAPKTIETNALGPCIGIIIYDPDSKQAMVGHFVDPHIDNLKAMLDEAVKHFSDITKLKVYVGGQALDRDDAPHFTQDKEKRAFVAQQLADHGFQKMQITTKYQDSASNTILRINTSDGVVDYDEETEWENYDH